MKITHNTNLERIKLVRKSTDMGVDINRPQEKPESIIKCAGEVGSADKSTTTTSCEYTTMKTSKIISLMDIGNMKSKKKRLKISDHC